ncbi:hypothetical protein GH714_022806 [Hevea brasiliensis]|uniref:Uncharacterized protein n=1 Tax=Hevea brasiliensis TaxID=3981 RepID=A0A6A6NIV7_HEVBR|nr:hypothetical protein GH714_022806 [Hevea brasiliensis]
MQRSITSCLRTAHDNVSSPLKLLSSMDEVLAHRALTSRRFKIYIEPRLDLLFSFAVRVFLSSNFQKFYARLCLQYRLYTLEVMSKSTDLVKEASESVMDSCAEDIDTVDEMVKDTILSRQTSINLDQFIGQRFVSQDVAIRSIAALQSNMVFQSGVVVPEGKME